MTPLTEEVVSKQLGDALTTETLEKISEKEFFNGDKINVGDYIIWVALKENDDLYNVVRIGKQHFDLFELEPSREITSIPRVILRNKI